MADNAENIRLLDSPTIRELDLVSQLFHQINRIIPEGQKLLKVRPSCTVRDAVELMGRHGYSQLPVVENEHVLGVFSYRSFARGAVGSLDEWNRQRTAPGDLRVDEFLEEFEFARVTDEMSRAFAHMDRDNGVLVGTHDRLIGILTPMDFLRYLHKVASPFVLLSEIELALRALIRLALSEEQITAAAHRCLAAAYPSKDVIPTKLEEMSFDNYQIMVSHTENWSFFEEIFGGVRARTSGKLKEIGEIRNALFHFRRQPTVHDSEVLNTHRNWLLNRAKQAELRQKQEGQP